MNSKKDTIANSLFLMISFLGIIVLQLVVRVNGISDDYLLYTFIFIILSILMLFALQAYTVTKGKRKKPSFCIPFFVIWILMCLCMLYSDIIVPKRYPYLSLVLLCIFTGVYILFMFMTRENRNRVLNVLITSIIVAFVIASVVCFLFRPFKVGIRYLGLSTNPNVYGMFLISVSACLFTKLDYMIQNQAKLIKCIIIYVCIGMAFFFLYMTGARTSFMAIFAVLLVWFFIRLVLSRKSKQSFIKYFLFAVPVIVVSFFVSYGMLATIPNLINKPIVFERDRDFLLNDDLTKVCYASETTPDTTMEEIKNDVEYAIENADKEPSLFKRISMIFSEGASLDTILNGRISIYKDFSSKIDMLGHYKYGKKVNGTFVVNAHNNTIQMGYSYGIPAMIFYILLCVFALVYSIRYYILYHKKYSCAVFPMLIVGAFLMTSLTECIMLPWQSLLAFAFYFCLGEIMNTQKE